MNQPMNDSVVADPESAELTRSIESMDVRDSVDAAPVIKKKSRLMPMLLLAGVSFMAAGGWVAWDQYSAKQQFARKPLRVIETPPQSSAQTTSLETVTVTPGNAAGVSSQPSVAESGPDVKSQESGTIKPIAATDPLLAPVTPGVASDALPGTAPAASGNQQSVTTQTPTVAAKQETNVEQEKKPVVSPLDVTAPPVKADPVIQAPGVERVDISSQVIEQRQESIKQDEKPVSKIVSKKRISIKEPVKEVKDTVKKREKKSAVVKSGNAEYPVTSAGLPGKNPASPEIPDVQHWKPLF